MSRYGIDYYGIAYYGGTNPLKFDASPLTATPSNYGQITLKWADPSGSWSQLVLVRNAYGYPVNPYDGVQLLTVNNGSDPVTFIDSNNLIQGNFYYYSIFVYNTTNYGWTNAGNAIGLSVQNWGSTDKMYAYLPEIYKITQPYSATSDWDNSDLYSFISNFGFQLDYDQTLSNLLINRYNIETVSGTAIPTMLNQFGQKYEQAIGLQQNRILLRDSVILTSQRGSKRGLVGYLEDFSGWGVPNPVPQPSFVINPSTGQYNVVPSTATEAPNPSVNGIVVGHNLMLDYNDSSFEESSGHWVSIDNTADYDQLQALPITTLSLTSNVATLTIGANSYDVGNSVTISGLPYPLFNTAVPVTLTAVTPTTISFALTGSDVGNLSGFNSTTGLYGEVIPYPSPWVESTAPILFPNKSDGILAVYNLSTIPQTINIYCGDDEPVINGIPVTTGTTYSFSFYAAKGAGATARTVTAKIKWFDRFGNYLSTSSGTGVSDNTALFSASYRPYVSAAAPSGAAYACPGISVASIGGSASNEHHFIDTAQFEAASSPTSFDEARQLHVTLRADRINELVNPHFVSPTTTSWITTGGSTSVVTTVLEPTATNFSITSTSLTSNVATVVLSTPHSFQVGATVYISGVSGSGVTASNYNGTRTITAVTLSSLSFAVTATNQSSLPTTGNLYQTGHVYQVTASGSTVAVNSWDGSTTSELCNIFYPSTSYTFSIYAKAVTAAESVTSVINWYDITHTLISSSTGSATAVSTGSWARPYVTGTAPATAAYASVEVTWSTTSGHVLYLDEAVFENAGILLPYFDGNGGPGLSTDFLWEGNNVNAARSHYYKNKLNVQTRLYTDVLSSQLLLGETAALYIGQPNT